MSNRIDTSIILGSYRYKSAIDTDLSLNIPFENTQREIDEFDRNNTLSLAQVFDDERQASTNFRPTAHIDLIFFNAYSGTTGLPNTNYFPFTNYLYYVNSETSALTTGVWSGYPQYFEFDFIRFDNNADGYTTGANPHINFVNKSASTYNWTQYISYAYENDYFKQLQYYRTSTSYYNWISGDGIPFYIVNPSTQLGRTIISFVCPVKHNLTVGEFVQIKIPGWAGYNGTDVFEVYSLGDGGYLSEQYVFNIYNRGFLGVTFSNNVQGTFKRIIDIKNSGETMSKYYVRKHKIITNVDDSILTKAAFDQNAFGFKRQYEYSSLTPDNQSRITIKEGNQSYLLSFSKDIDISKYVDNLNRPLSELFFTIINRGYFGWMNFPWNTAIPNAPSIKQGFGFNLANYLSEYWNTFNTINLTNIPTNFYTKPGGFTFYYNGNLKSGDTLDGDFCEYNQYEQRERIVSELYHKMAFNPNLFTIGYLLTNPNKITNPEGYYYQPHHSLTIKVYSDYIEEGEINKTDLVPNYAYYSNFRKKLRWRDIYTYGFKDADGNGVDYPFLNNTHYPSTKIIFRVFPEGYIKENINVVAQPDIDGCE